MKVLVVCAIFVSPAIAQDPRAALQSALTAEKSGRADAAIREFHQILAGPATPEVKGQARLELVRIYERRADWWNAAAQLRELRETVPSEAEYAYQLGVVYRNLSKSTFEHMQAIAPRSARVQQMFGEQYAAAGDSQKAVAAYEKAIAADPKLPGSHLALAVIYLRGSQPGRARAEIDKELEIAPDSAVAKQVRQALAGAPR